ncbi:MAG TPA: hypothetical protein VJ953_11185 [Saprospiraceae bacterium]|nr:hypothetical protein [Saprospiraceae bacterium]
MPSIYQAFFLFCCSILFSSCFVPREVIRIAPDESERVFWHQGQAIAEAQLDNIIARAAYSHANRDYLVFDVEVFNESDQPCLLSPENFSLTTAQNLRLRAADPEKEMFALDMNSSRNEARAKNWAVAGGVALATAAVVAAVSSDGADNIDGLVGDGYNAVDASLDLAAGVANIAWGLSFHNDPVLSVPANVLPPIGSYDFWQSVALRRTTIMPGSSIRGLVAFPRNKQRTAGTLLLDVPLECAVFRFRFTQMNFQP